jgi:glutamate 5-kinase
MTFQVDHKEGLFYRQTLFDQAKRVVIKVGSAVLTGSDGLHLEIIGHLARQISFLCSTGREVILVSSGAVAAGRRRLGIPHKVHEKLRVKQALAAMGQALLMQAYEQAFSTYNQQVAQILLTHADLAQRERYLNVRNTILTLFEFGVVPIINENDTVSVKELRVGDNDTLGAQITNMIGADMYIMLTDVEGLCTANPTEDISAKPIYTVARIDETIEGLAGNSGSLLGTGGMQSKIRAAKMVAACGGSSFIGPGRNPEILQELFSGNLTGTFFLPNSEKIKERKHWIGYVLRPAGFLDLDEGACRAILEQGRSLLPSGVSHIEGSFEVGTPVHCRCPDGSVIAAGLVNYSSDDLVRIKRKKSKEIKEILGFCDSDEVIHRDNLVLLNQNTIADPDGESTP